MKLFRALLLAALCATGGDAKSTGNSKNDASSGGSKSGSGTCGACCQLLNTYLDIYNAHMQGINGAGAACVTPYGIGNNSSDASTMNLTEEDPSQGFATIVCPGQMQHLLTTFESTKYFLKLIGQLSNCEIAKWFPELIEAKPEMPKATDPASMGADVRRKLFGKPE